MAISKDDILEAVGQMTVMDLNDLVKAFEEKFGVSAAAMAVAGPAGAGGGGAAAAEERAGGLVQSPRSQGPVAVERTAPQARRCEGADLPPGGRARPAALPL